MFLKPSFNMRASSWKQTRFVRCYRPGSDDSGQDGCGSVGLLSWKNRVWKRRMNQCFWCYWVEICWNREDTQYISCYQSLAMGNIWLLQRTALKLLWYKLLFLGGVCGNGHKAELPATLQVTKKEVQELACIQSYIFTDSVLSLWPVW